MNMELGLLGGSKHTESWKSHTCLLLTLTRVMCIMWPIFDCMKANNIHVLAILPHTSHIVQALDSTPFAQFKKLWQRHLKEWNFDNKAKCLPKVSFWEVFWPAWSHSMTVGSIQSGFRKTGVYPVKSKFTPSIVTDSKKICSL